MKPKHRRLVFLSVVAATLALAALLVSLAFRDNLQFFYSPSEIKKNNIQMGQVFRLGGMVEKDSLSRKEDGTLIEFRITDYIESITVQYRGILPDLFREGQGAIMTGRIVAGGIFVADNVLAKHDENYMPPEVADALRRAGKPLPESHKP